MKVYVVLMGDYEFRGIHSIHSTRELAQALIDRTGDSSADIEEYDVDEIDPTTLPFERRKFQVIFTPTGAVKEVRFASTSYSGNDYSRRVEVTVWATTREEAVTEARPIFTAWREGRIPGDGRENVFVLGRPEAGE